MLDGPGRSQVGAPDDRPDRFRGTGANVCGTAPTGYSVETLRNAAPVARPKAGHVWAWPDVEAWAMATGRLK